MMEFTAEMIAGFLGGEIVGNKEAKVHTVSSIEEGKAGSLSYLTNPKYEAYIYTTGASASGQPHVRTRAAAFGDAHQGRRRRRLRPETPRNVQCRKTPPQRHKPPFPHDGHESTQSAVFPNSLVHLIQLSPVTAYIRRTPAFSSVSTNWSATFFAIV